ncbi:MAG: hypothetical protein KAR12_00665 [Methylococcales bacterium]|nr:hypothetical protein [Methylococcales bacterium]
MKKINIIKMIFFVSIISVLSSNLAIAKSEKFEGIYHSAKDVNEKITIYKTGDKEFSINNSTGKWKVKAYMGVSKDKGGPYNCYKGVISWPRKGAQDVGFISMSLQNDGEEIKAFHRRNFWKGKQNTQDVWSEIWVKEK